MTKVVGLTGGIATGKSLASAYLEELGATIVDADQISHEVAEVPEVKAALEKEWPLAFQNHVLNRQQLGHIIFSSPEEREKLNRLLHPEILKRILDAVESCPSPVCVLVAPLLFETNLQAIVDETWVIDVPKEIQLERLMKRQDISKDEAMRMIASQMPASQRLAHANRILDNGSSIDEFKKRIHHAWESVIKSDERTPHH